MGEREDVRPPTVTERLLEVDSTALGAVGEATASARRLVSAVRVVNCMFTTAPGVFRLWLRILRVSVL